ncbi:MAG TPA: hypothetical protein VJQ45_07480 [Ktedonobacterales bacterium]|nr:hypothetical protein [Ktedonobacterales bacterium]
MPSADRYWPRIFAVDLAFIAAMIGGVDWYLTEMLPLEIHVGHSPWSMLAFSNLCVATSGAFSIIGALVWCYQARSRMRSRQRAVDGDLEAIPLARITPQPQDAPDVATEPLVLAWRALGPRGGFARVYVLSYLAFLILVPLVDLGLVVLSLRLGLNTVAIGIAGTIAAVLVIVAVLARMMQHRVPTKRVERLVATSDGLLWQRTGARDKEIPWRDARLVEIWRPDKSYSLDFPCGYSLYGRTNSITWHIPAPWHATPEGMTTNELKARQFRLLDLIMAKTHLAPRTFVKSLQS